MKNWTKSLFDRFIECLAYFLLSDYYEKPKRVSKVIQRIDEYNERRVSRFCVAIEEEIPEPPKTQSQADIVANLIKTPAGRQRLAQAMIAPLRTGCDYDISGCVVIEDELVEPL